MRGNRQPAALTGGLQAGLNGPGFHRTMNVNAERI